VSSSRPSLLVALVLATAPLAGAAAPFAYVPNEGSGTLSVIDTATDQVVGEVAVGQKPRGTVVSADGRTAYVSDQPNNALVIVDLAARKRSGTIAVGALPAGLALAGTTVWAATRASAAAAHRGGTLTVFTPGMSTADVNLDPNAYWQYTNSPYDNERRRHAIERHGFEDGLKVSHAGKVLNP